MARFALFDFDSTLTSEDTTRYLLLELVRLRPWKAIHLARLVATRLVGSPAHLQIAKNQCIGACLKGLELNTLAAACERFRQRVNPLLRPSVLQRARDCQASGIQVVVVTASPEFAVMALFEGDGFWCVGTRYSLSKDRYDGAMDGPPCYGEHKPAAICARGIDHGDDVVEAWSDSISDLPMMLLASNRFWVCGSAEWIGVQKVDPAGVRIDPK